MGWVGYEDDGHVGKGLVDAGGVGAVVVQVVLWVWEGGAEGEEEEEV